MRSKVVIENGETNIVLTPQNDFETSVLDKLFRNKKSHTLHTSVDASYNYGDYKNHKLTVNIKECRGST